MIEPCMTSEKAPRPAGTSLLASAVVIAWLAGSLRYSIRIARKSLTFVKVDR